MGNNIGGGKTQPLECEKCGGRWTFNAWRCITRGQPCPTRSGDVEVPVDQLTTVQKQQRYDGWKRQEGLIVTHNKKAKTLGTHVVHPAVPNWKNQRVDPEWLCSCCSAKPKQMGMRKFLSNFCSG